VVKDKQKAVNRSVININLNKVMEIGYLFQKKYWHQGYASEAAISCKHHAFDKLNAIEGGGIILEN